MQISFPKHRCLDEYLSVSVFSKQIMIFFCCILFLVNNAWKHCWWISQTISSPFFSSCFISFSKTFSFPSSDLISRGSVKHWWCLAYKCNLCTTCLCHSVYQLLVALLALQRCLTSLPMLMEDRQKMQGKCITLTAQSTGPIEGRSITSNSHVKQAHFLLQLLPGWVLILQILHICRRRVSSLSYVFHTSLNISKALALPLPHTITSSQMSCIWGSCASSSKK